MELKTVRIEKPEEINFILGQSHFIKTVEDIYETMVGAVPGAKFGVAFCEASGPSALTQNVKDLLASREIENILDNTDFMILLSQAQSDRAILAKQIGISEHQLSYITQSNSGEGLLFYGSVTIPFVDRFPRGEIYDLLTTKPEDAANGKQAE